MPSQIEIKQLLGAIDTDSPNEVIGQGFVREARNIEWFGTAPNLRAQIIQGNTLVPNEFLPENGLNTTIGCHYDAVNHRLFFFNYNSSGTHGIYIYYTLLNTFQRLIENGINTDGDVLGFSPFVRIDSMEIIYGDGVAGDLLIFIDSLKRIRKLNIQRLLNGGYTTIKDAFLRLIKAPPIPPPYCVYENDTTVQNNNMINSVFNITATYLYDDFEQSVLGSAARQVYPSDPFNPKNNIDKSRNSRMAIYVPTGDQNVKKIRIYGKQTKDGATTDWFIIDTLIKADLGISDNTVYRYLFYNNGNYITADPTFTVLDFDSVPQMANALALLNGNTVSVGACTEGYDYFNPTFNITTTNVISPLYALNGTLFFAATNGIFTSGQPQVTIYLTGVGVNDGFGNPTTLEKYPQVLFVKAKSSGTDISFSAAGVTTSIADNLSALQGAATSAGWVFVSNTSNSLTIYYPTGNVVFNTAYFTNAISDTSPYPTSVSAHFPQAAYAYGVEYQDEDGKNNGVISNVTGNIKTQPIGGVGQIPCINIDLSGTLPPPWAVSYEIMRTDNLTYSKYFPWLSNAAYSNIGTASQNQYAYFDISNINYYNTQINATEGVVSYGFSSGDRIRVLGKYDIGGSLVPLNFDYAVIGVVVNPNINGIVKIGTFVQITYPTADINANFAFDGTINFQNYRILLYAYKAYLPTNQNVFFRTGQQYGIGNPGTNLAYHMGNIGDNQVSITDGDVFFRQRTVPVVDTYFIPSIGYDQGSTWSTLRINVNGSGSVLDPTLLINNGLYEIKGGSNQAGGQGVHDYPSDADNDYTFKNLSGSISLTLRLQGIQPITDKNDPNGVFAMWVKTNTPSQTLNNNIIVNQPGMAKSVERDFPFDATIIVPPQGKVWLQNYMVNEMLAGGFSLQLSVIRNYTFDIFDFSFSDIYALKTNSDNKPSVIDTTGRKTFYSTLFRWGQAYQLGTELNNSNRFFPLDFDEFDKSYGQIQRLYVWQRELRIFQERRCGHVGVYAKFIKDNGGNSSLVTTDDIISKNNIEYYEGSHGLGNQPSGLINSGFQSYVPDPVTGDLLRLSLDGIKNISEEFHVQAFSGNNLPNYLNQYTYQFGGNASLIGCYNFKKDKDGEVIFLLQGGTGSLGTIPGQAIAFNERQNAFSGIYELNSDAIVCCENQLFSFNNGNLWIHNNVSSNGYANFYGVAKQASLTMVFNDKVALKKKYLAIGYQSFNNKIWSAINVGDIKTSFYNPQTFLQQISQLLPVDFEVNEGNIFASFLYDANSMADATLALVEGDYLLGNWIEIKLMASGNDFNFIYLSFVKWIASPKTP